jgi:tRNA(fMet)-specific endonuclease VapC
VILLDTDHFSVLKYADSARAVALAGRLRAAGDSGAVTVVTVEEQLRGWLAQIHGAKDVRDQIEPYRELGELLQAFSRQTIIPFN